MTSDNYYAIVAQDLINWQSSSTDAVDVTNIICNANYCSVEPQVWITQIQIIVETIQVPISFSGFCESQCIIWVNVFVTVDSPGSIITSSTTTTITTKTVTNTKTKLLTKSFTTTARHTVTQTVTSKAAPTQATFVLAVRVNAIAKKRALSSTIYYVGEGDGVLEAERISSQSIPFFINEGDLFSGHEIVSVDAASKQLFIGRILESNIAGSFALDPHGRLTFESPSNKNAAFCITGNNLFVVFENESDSVDCTPATLFVTSGM